MRFKPQDLALICSFAALYLALSSASLFPIIGAVGKFITLATVMAPLMGIILGPYIGAAAVSIGGLMWSTWQIGAFGFLSFIPGAVTALCSGFLYKGKRIPPLILYVTLLFLMAFYPTIGPAWLYPYFLWFHLIGLVVLMFPLTPMAIDYARRNNNLARLGLGIGIISLASTLLGQMTGNVMFELMYWPAIYPLVEYWRTAQWRILTFVYPLERSVITLIAALVGAPLIKAIRASGYPMGDR